jgi:hypothetical protein
MSFLNFLTQDQPNKSTTSTLTTSQVPQYLSDYLYNLMSGAYSAAQEEYQPYEGPRVAQFTQDQQNAFDTVRDTAGSYKPYLDSAGQTFDQAGGMSPTGAAQPYFNAASQNLPGVIDSYMNPYEENVIGRMGDMAQRQITEKLMPALGDQFIRAGQFGSTRQQELAQRGVRDVSEGLSGQIGDYLAKGYATAGQQAQEDLRRQASIGQAQGQLSANEMQQLANIGTQQSALGQRAQALGLQEAGALETIGQTQQRFNQANLDLAYQDFQRQTAYPKDQLSFLSSIIRGLPVGGGSSSQVQTGMGNSYSPSPLAQLAGAATGAATLSKLMSGG